MTPAQQRALFPLRAPRWQTLAWSPIHTVAAAVDGYYEAFFYVFTPGVKKGSRPWMR